MRKRAFFEGYRPDRWPDKAELEKYFLAPPGQRWIFPGGGDDASLLAEGVDGTEHLGEFKGRIDVRLAIFGNPDLGVLLLYTKSGGGRYESYSSKGDLSRLREWVDTVHGTPLSVGLFIPFEAAWQAVQEFMDTEGKLPQCIEWVASDELPPGTFRDH